MPSKRKSKKLRVRQIRKARTRAIPAKINMPAEDIMRVFANVILDQLIESRLEAKVEKTSDFS